MMSSHFLSRKETKANDLTAKIESHDMVLPMEGSGTFKADVHDVDGDNVDDDNDD